MAHAIEGVTVSPVNIEDRKALGVKPGDTVRVHQKIQDKGKTRIQVFDGIVLARKHGSEPGATFTVRKIASGVGVEKIFPLYSPTIDKIEITKRAKVRRAKLYYLREKVSREIKRQMRRMSLVSMATESDIEAAARKEREAKEAEEAAAAAEAEAANTEEEAASVAETPESEASTTEAPAEGEKVAATESADTPTETTETEETPVAEETSQEPATESEDTSAEKAEAPASESVEEQAEDAEDTTETTAEENEKDKEQK